MIHELATAGDAKLRWALSAAPMVQMLPRIRPDVWGAAAAKRLGTDTQMLRRALAVGKQSLPTPRRRKWHRSRPCPATARHGPTPAGADLRYPVPRCGGRLLASESLTPRRRWNYADEAVKTLPNSRHVVFPGTGHEGQVLHTYAAKPAFPEIMRQLLREPLRTQMTQWRCVAANSCLGHDLNSWPVAGFKQTCHHEAATTPSPSNWL